MIIFNDNVSLGDALATFPVMVLLTEKYPCEKIYSFWTNEEIGSLFPRKYNHLPLSFLPKAGQHQVFKVSNHDIMRYGMSGINYGGHIQAVALAHWGFEEQTKTYQALEIEYPNDLSVPSYDFIISPFVLADSSRIWSFENWQKVINFIHNKYVDATICVIGSTTIPKDEDLRKFTDNIDVFHTILNDSLKFHFENVNFYYDQPLQKVAKLLENVKRLFISVDTGTSRLMAGIGKPHLILIHNSVGLQWATYPGAETIYKGVSNITVEEVIKKIQEMVK